MLFLRHLRDLLPPFSILTPKITSSEVTRWAKLVLPGVPIAVFDEKTEYVHCQRLFMTTLLFSASHFFHPLVIELIDEIRTMTSASGPATERSFITRPTAGSVRRLSNQSEIETLAVERGLTAGCTGKSFYCRSDKVIRAERRHRRGIRFWHAQHIIFHIAGACSVSQLHGYLPIADKPITWLSCRLYPSEPRKTGHVGGGSPAAGISHRPCYFQAQVAQFGGDQ